MLARKTHVAIAAACLIASGLVTRVLYGPRGEVNGVLVGSDGIVVRFPPRVGVQLGSSLAVGHALYARGHGTRNNLGTAFAAIRIGSSMETSRDVFRPPVGPLADAQDARPVPPNDGPSAIGSRARIRPPQPQADGLAPPIVLLLTQMLAKKQGAQKAVLFTSGDMLASQLVFVVVAAASGRLAGSLGRKPLFLFAFAALALRGVLYALSDKPAALIAVQCMDSPGAGVFGVVGVLIIADLTKGTGRFNTAQGAIATAPGLGACLSNAVAGYLARRSARSRPSSSWRRSPPAASPSSRSSCPRPARWPAPQPVMHGGRSAWSG